MVTVYIKPNGNRASELPQIEFVWDYADFGAISNAPGYSEDYPLPLSSLVQGLVRDPKWKDLNGFYQVQESWNFPQRQSDMPPTSGKTSFMFEFWTGRIRREKFDAFVANLEVALSSFKVPFKIEVV